MFNLKLFVPVLALAAMALPAGANTVVTYCDGTGCGSNTISAFNTALGSDNATWASTTNILFGTGAGQGVFSNNPTTDNEYTDDLTGAIFQATHTMTISSGTLETTPEDEDPLTITIPATYTFVLLTLTNDQSGTGGLCLDGGCDWANITNGSTTVVAYINTDVTGAWQIQLSRLNGTPSVAVENFNVANIGTQGGGGGETPEVATFILIGSGLLAMRWMRRLPKRFFRTPQPAC